MLVWHTRSLMFQRLAQRMLLLPCSPLPTLPLPQTTDGTLLVCQPTPSHSGATGSWRSSTHAGPCWVSGYTNMTLCTSQWRHLPPKMLCRRGKMAALALPVARTQVTDVQHTVSAFHLEPASGGCRSRCHNATADFQFLQQKTRTSCGKEIMLCVTTAA
jgi:hypothetical protein